MLNIECHLTDTCDNTTFMRVLRSLLRLYSGIVRKCDQVNLDSMKEITNVYKLLVCNMSIWIYVLLIKLAYHYSLPIHSHGI